MSSYLVREEDGTSKHILEDGSGAIILEETVTVNAVVTQLTVEVLRGYLPTNARLTQLAVEVLIPYLPRRARFYAQIV